MNRPASKAGIRILSQGTLTLVRPLTQRANEWISQHLPDHSKWFGSAPVIEHNFLANLLPGMIGDGPHVTQ